MDKNLKRVVVLLAHPNMGNSHANKVLLEAIKEMEEVAVYNLYEMPADDVFNMDEWSRIISHATAVVYQFPFYWMSAPHLLKQWQDQVFTHLAKTPAVAGKPLMVAITTGSDFEAYRSGGRNGFTIDELLRPYQAGALHAGMLWQRPFVIYGVGTSDTEKNLAKGADAYKKKLAAFAGDGKTEEVW